MGGGSFGEVWCAHDPDLDRDVAIKTLRPDRQYSPDAVRRFLEEGRKLARLQHAGVVRVHDVGHDAGRCFIVSELIAGETLADRLEREGKLAWPAAVGLAADVAEALHTAHVLGLLPFAVILLCPLLHMFMHGGHGGHDDAGHDHSGAGGHEHQR